MCIWFELISSFNKPDKRFLCGISTAHIFSGETTIFEYETTWSMNATTFDELERHISVFSPNEIVLISGMDENTTTKIEKFIGTYGRNVHRVFLHGDTEQSLYAQRCEKQVYVNQILENVYGVGTYRQSIEFQENALATQSLCYLLNFLQEHNQDLIKKIVYPVFTNSSTRMILANHTLQQLNIISCNMHEESGRYSSVHALLNECKTAMGKRRFHRELTSPTIDSEWLETQYSNTETYLKYSTDMKRAIREKMGGIIDIEKWLRQLILCKNTPKTFVGLHRSLSNTVYLLETVFTEKSEELEYTRECLTYIEHHFDIEKCIQNDSMTTFSENFVRRGISQELDNLTDTYHLLETRMNILHTRLNELISETDHVKIHRTEKLGISLQITNTRSRLLKDAFSKYPLLVIDTECSIPTGNIHFKKISSSSSIVEIDSDEIHHLMNHLNSMSEKINTEIARVYLHILLNIESDLYNRLEYIADAISELDVLQCRAFVAEKYRLCKPTIMVQNGESSGFQVKGLRHILIEHIQTDEIYVENDLTMSADYVDAPTGILLFGTNAVGKTSFIRALGIAVIMAQSGFYVAASSFEYKPYHAIYSRIWGNDNLFKGLSTFAVEMSELRVILNTSDKNSLILGDELCSGTETESALSIFSAGLEHLSKKGATYLFATHFHEITAWDEVRKLDRLVFKHMSVHYDSEIDGLVYDRKLKDGAGNRMYGLEVCKSLHLDLTFLDRAYDLRRKYFKGTGGTLSQVQSQYNAQKLRGQCEMCGESIGEEIHHLIPQVMADTDGYIDGGSLHKNHKANYEKLRR
jgi:DNA mismatch repair protein MutS